MDINQIIKDNLPDGTELSDKAITAIAKEIKAVQGLEFVPKESYSKKTELVDKLEKELKEAQGAVSDVETYRKKYEDEVSAHNATKSTYIAEKEAADIDGKVSVALKNAGFNEKSLGDLMNDKRFDRAIVKRGKDGTISNTDEIVASVKSIGNWGAHFGTVEKQGSDIGKPPVAPPAKPTAHKDMNAFIRGITE